VIHVVQVEAEGTTDHETEVATAAPAFLQEAGEGQRIWALAVTVQERDEGAIGQTPRHLFILANLHQLQARVTREKLLVVPNIVGEGWA